MTGILMRVTAAATLVLLLCSSSPVAALDHGDFDELLREYVAPDGIRYRAWSSNTTDVEALAAYVRRMESVDPGELPQDEALAYWINVYNAVTLSLVLEHYPVESIKKIGGRFRSPWKKQLFGTGDERLSLNGIENDVIRPTFEEPRIHFALNCAAVGCPPLRPEAYDAARLDEQLEEQTARFLHDANHTWIDEKGTLHLSKIFDWYSSDFATEGSVVDWVRPYIEKLPARGEKIPVEYVDYDWSLNEAKE